MFGCYLRPEYFSIPAGPAKNKQNKPNQIGPPYEVDRKSQFLPQEGSAEVGYHNTELRMHSDQ